MLPKLKKQPVAFYFENGRGEVSVFVFSCDRITECYSLCLFASEAEAEFGKAHPILLYPCIPDSQTSFLQAAETQHKESTTPAFDCWAH